MTLRPDQEEVAKNLIELLRTHSVGVLMAPTGWGKSYVASFIIRQLRGRWLWASSLISALVSAAKALDDFNIRFYLSTGRERLCLRGYSYADFIARNPCARCSYNMTVPKDLIRVAIMGVSNYGELKGLAEGNSICAYNLQEESIKTLLREYDTVAILMNYARINKFLKYSEGLILDEIHNMALPRITTLPRRLVAQILERLNIDMPKSAELLRDLLAEKILDIAMMEQPIDINDIINYVQSSITYYDEDRDEFVGLQIYDKPQGGRYIVYMSATPPPSLLSLPTVRVQPSTLIAKIPRGSLPMTMQMIEQHKDKIMRLLERYISNEPTLVFTTSSKLLPDGVPYEILYEDEIKDPQSICNAKIAVLYFFGRYSEGVRLNCFHRVLLYSLPLLPQTVLQRLKSRGIHANDIIIVKSIQAMGRILPREDAEIILFDARYRMYCDTFRQYGIQCVED